MPPSFEANTQVRHPPLVGNSPALAVKLIRVSDQSETCEQYLLLSEAISAARQGQNRGQRQLKPGSVLRALPSGAQRPDGRREPVSGASAEDVDSKRAAGHGLDGVARNVSRWQGRCPGQHEPRTPIVLHAEQTLVPRGSANSQRGGACFSLP
jgi:hypothetical protein